MIIGGECLIKSLLTSPYDYLRSDKKTPTSFDTTWVPKFDFGSEESSSSLIAKKFRTVMKIITKLIISGSIKNNRYFRVLCLKHTKNSSECRALLCRFNSTTMWLHFYKSKTLDSEEFYVYFSQQQAVLGETSTHTHTLPP